MGSLHGPQDRRKRANSPASKPARTRRPPWRKPGLTRVQRVIAFLESLPITKGILAGQPTIPAPCFSVSMETSGPRKKSMLRP